jgi:hypothetical protein
MLSWLVVIGLAPDDADKVASQVNAAPLPFALPVQVLHAIQTSY